MGKSSFDSVNINLQLNEIYNEAMKAVLAGRACLLGYFGKINNVEEKDKAAGLVSEADRESETLIKGMLAKSFPDFDFLGEETAYLEGKEQFTASSRPRWILDPLDGTTNFVHKFPIFCISLALEVNGEIEVGIIDMPMLNQTFTSIRGHGAWCIQPDGTREKLSVSKTENFEQAFMSTGFVNEKREVLSEQLKIFEDVVWKAQAVRRPGAAAYDLALIASGVFDLYWEKNLKPWDSAAGLLLVKEAGGVVITYEGENYDPFKKSSIAGNETIVRKFQSEIQPIISK
ncbi:MAG: inositol monophosphatase [Pseudobdellovibrio sp.]|nr:inositol monophosphatase [Pseudobdellovibrio sp.]